MLAAGRVRSKKKKQTKKNAKKSTPPKTHYEIHSSPATACNSRRHAMKHVPILSRFHRSRACGNRPRTALAIIKNDECYTHAHTDRLIK